MLHAEIDRLRLELGDVKAERDAAFAMSRCECAGDECCANLVRKDEHIRELEAFRFNIAREVCVMHEADWHAPQPGSDEAILAEVASGRDELREWRCKTFTGRCHGCPDCQPIGGIRGSTKRRNAEETWEKLLK